MLLFVSPKPEPVQSTAPLFTERCPAGFPSLAADYTEEELDLNAYCIRRPAATFFVRAIGDSMRDMGLHSGDLMVVDKAEKPQQGDIVIAETDGENGSGTQWRKPPQTADSLQPELWRTSHDL